MSRAGNNVPVAKGYQGAVYIRESPQGRVVVKAPLGRGLMRLVRRAMLRHEHAIYAHLHGLTGIPKCLGLEEGEKLVLECIEGKSLRELDGRVPDPERFLPALLEIIQSLHRAGVAHGDLKRKDNILAGSDGRPYVIDFGTAVAAPPGAGFLQRLLFGQLRRMDLNAWIKLKYRGGQLPMTPADLQYHRPTLIEGAARVVRRAWRAATFRRVRKARRARR